MDRGDSSVAHCSLTKALQARQTSNTRHTPRSNTHDATNTVNSLQIGAQNEWIRHFLARRQVVAGVVALGRGAPQIGHWICHHLGKVCCFVWKEKEIETMCLRQMIKVPCVARERLLLRLRLVVVGSD